MNSLKSKLLTAYHYLLNDGWKCEILSAKSWITVIWCKYERNFLMYWCSLLSGADNWTLKGAEGQRWTREARGNW